MEQQDTSRPISDGVKNEVSLRLRKIEGQIRGIQRMVDENRDCRQVVQQLAAVKASIASLNTMVAESYARECLCCGEQVEDVEVLKLLEVLKTAR